MLKVYYNEKSPTSFKLSVYLTETGIPHELVPVSFEDLDAPEFRKKFPVGLLPVIEDSFGPLGESFAIMQHLSRLNGGKLIPRDEKAHALMDQAMGVEASMVQPTFGNNGIFGELGKPENEQNKNHIARLMPMAQEIGNLLGELLGERDYFAGEFSLADIQLYAGISKAVHYQVIQTPPSNLVSWVDRVKKRPATQKAAEWFPMYRD